MRTLWNKFRFWLIKKLGGQVVFPIKPKIECRYARPIILCVDEHIDLAHRMDDVVFEEMAVKERLVIHIVKELLDRRLIKIEVSDDLISLQRRYRGRLMVYNEEGGEE